MRIAIGNGVRTDIWSEFLDRFGDIKVRELYAATEGNIGFINYTSKVGAVGRVNLLHRVSPKVVALTLRNVLPETKNKHLIILFVVSSSLVLFVFILF